VSAAGDLREALEKVKERLLLESLRPETCCRIRSRKPVETDYRGLMKYMRECKALMVMFYSPTCPYCRALAPLYEEAASIYGDRLLFARVNVYESPEAAAAFGVMGVPTVIGVVSGRPVLRLVGLVDPETLERAILELMRAGGCSRSVASS